jgi:hypothetical protein
MRLVGVRMKHFGGLHLTHTRWELACRCHWVRLRDFFNLRWSAADWHGVRTDGSWKQNLSKVLKQSPVVWIWHVDVWTTPALSRTRVQLPLCIV